ncbi:PDZ domain-containing protein [Virgibacillus phasianinus]|uniref:PDZ domain-containing protein n=1 Tax=Virgibacillus phasianinus TaxID=2017483 RepID=A0A220U4H6_9BACI|nr:PDZ domain-containing protein [Virgibacillus phasianinus]ASK62731.1 PDZ domain-containing protein [Virgibacillus phasianinus]
MLEVWAMEFAKGIGKLFLNPLTYWTFIFIIFAGIRRIKRERINFGIKIADVFSEWKSTWTVSIFVGILVSGICIGAGVVFSYETIALLCAVTILLSLSMRFTFLSPSYTIGGTLILLLFMPIIINNQTYFDHQLFEDINFAGIALLAGLFLLVEAILTYRIKQGETYPNLTVGSRGKWVGFHHLKKLSFIPFFTLVPTGLIAPFAAYWPSISVDGETYGVLLVPFIIGFDHSVKNVLPEVAAKSLGRKMGLLGMIVLLIAIGSIFYWSLSIAAVVIAILGREFVSYRHRSKDGAKQSFFSQSTRGLTVIAIVPHTPAERLGIQIGEKISKVNGRTVQNVDQFYQFLQISGAFAKLEVLDRAWEPRLLQTAIYQDDHHELGLVFVKDRYQINEKNQQTS